MSDGVEQRVVFGEDAEAYDRVRPSYPSDLIDDVVALAGLPCRAVDAGCGTGKATVMLAERGVAGVGVEPDPAMAVVARRKLAAFPAWRVDVSDFEEWIPDPGEQLDLVTCAQGWHWIDRERGTKRAEAVQCCGPRAGSRSSVTSPDRRRRRCDARSTRSTASSRPSRQRGRWRRKSALRPARRSARRSSATTPATADYRAGEWVALLELVRPQAPPAFPPAAPPLTHRGGDRASMAGRVTDCAVTMTECAYSSPDGPPSRRGPLSTTADFRKLTPLVLMRALARAGTVVCEPTLRVHLELPAGSLGTVMAALARLGAPVEAPSLRGTLAVIATLLPATRLRDLQRQLPGLTGGEGVLASTFAGYDLVAGDQPARRRTTASPLNREEYLLRLARRAG